MSTKRIVRLMATLVGAVLAVVPASTVVLLVLGMVAGLAAISTLGRPASQGITLRLALACGLAVPGLVAAALAGPSTQLLLASAAVALLGLAWALSEAEQREHRLAWGVQVGAKLQDRWQAARIADDRFRPAGPTTTIDLTGSTPRVTETAVDGTETDVTPTVSAGWVDPPASGRLSPRSRRSS